MTILPLFIVLLTFFTELHTPPNILFEMSQTRVWQELLFTILYIQYSYPKFSFVNQIVLGLPTLLFVSLLTLPVIAFMLGLSL